MENSFGSDGLFRGIGWENEATKIQAADKNPLRFKWDWRLFWIYGCVWIAISSVLSAFRRPSAFFWNSSGSFRT